MKYAADFRREARISLQGKWVIAIIAALIAAWLGGIDMGGPEIKIELNDGNFRAGLQLAGQNIISTDGLQVFWPTVAGIAAGLGTMAIVMGIAMFFVGAIVEVGYASFNLFLVDKENTAEIVDLFNYFTYWKSIICTRLLKSLYIFLWSLLFVIPGIMKSYAYAMTPFLLAEHPNLTASQAIRLSEDLMDGYKSQLFVLDLTFLGWNILAAMTWNLGNILLNPYKNAAYAAFYRQLQAEKQYIDCE